MSKRIKANKYLDKNLIINKIYKRALVQFSMLESCGYTVVKFTDYHFRINELLDIYPLSMSFYDRKNKARGTIIRTWKQIMDSDDDKGIGQNNDLYNFVKVFINKKQ